VETITAQLRKVLARIDKARAAEAEHQGREAPAPLVRDRRNFRAFRRTFRTTAEGANNSPKRLNAIRRIMGHEMDGMDPHYMRDMPVKRLRRITDYVRRM